MKVTSLNNKSPSLLSCKLKCSNRYCLYPWLDLYRLTLYIFTFFWLPSACLCSGDVVLACFVPKMDVEDRHWIAKEHVENNWSFVHTTGEFGTRPGPTRSCRKNRNISCYLCTFFPQLFLGPLLLQHHHRDHNIRPCLMPNPCIVYSNVIRVGGGWLDSPNYIIVAPQSPNAAAAGWSLMMMMTAVKLSGQVCVLCSVMKPASSRPPISFFERCGTFEVPLNSAIKII